MANKSRRQKKKLISNSRGYGSRAGSSSYGYYLNPGYSCGDTKRNVWANVGYPDTVDFNMLWSVSTRGIGKAGIHRIVNKCWQEDPIITDGEKDEEKALTPFEQDVNVLINDHHLFARLKGVDWRNRIGRYAGIIPIVKDAGSPESLLSGLSSVKSLFKLVPVMESQIDVTNVGTNADLNDPHYGMPIHYNFRENVSGDRNPITNTQYQLHPSRVFVFAEGADDGSIFGVPVNEAGYNALMDMEKIGGASGEGLFKNAKQRSVININDNQTAGALASDKKKKEKFDENVSSFERDLDGMLVTYGMDVKTLQSTLADPTHAWTIGLNTYCATIECPATILIGQQTGRLASDEDQKDWALTAQSRCNNVLTPSLIVPFLKYMVNIGIVRPPVNDIQVTWPNFLEPNPSAKLDSGKKMIEINKIARDAGTTEAVFTSEEIREASGYTAAPEGDVEMFIDAVDDKDLNNDIT